MKKIVWKLFLLLWSTVYLVLIAGHVTGYHKINFNPSAWSASLEGGAYSVFGYLLFILLVLTFGEAEKGGGR